MGFTFGELESGVRDLAMDLLAVASRIEALDVDDRSVPDDSIFVSDVVGFFRAFVGIFGGECEYFPRTPGVPLVRGHGG